MIKSTNQVSTQQAKARHYEKALRRYRERDGSNPILNRLTGREVQQILSSTETSKSKRLFDFTKELFSSPRNFAKLTREAFPEASKAKVGAMPWWLPAAFAAA